MSNSSRGGFLVRVWNGIKQYRKAKSLEQFVGQDKFGNKYYEMYTESKGPQRRVQPLDEDIHNIPEVPVEWMTWLRGRRSKPPTEQEIDRNVQTMLRTQARAKDLEELHLKEKHGLMEEESSEKAPIQLEKTDEHSSQSTFPVYKNLETTPGEFADKKKG